MINIDQERGIMEILNVTPVINEDGRYIGFTTAVSIGEIGLVYPFLTYDETAQRGYKMKKMKSGVVKELRIKKDNLKDIKRKMLDGEFFHGGWLAWNARSQHEKYDEQFKYDVDNGSLQIKLDTTLTLPDSALRHKAFAELCEESPNHRVLKRNLPLLISFWTHREEQMMFAEINSKGSRADKSKALVLGHEPECELLLEVLDGAGIRHMVELESNYRPKGKWLTFNQLYSATFEPKHGAFRNIRRTDLPEVKEYLVKFISELIALRPVLQDQESIEQIRNSSVLPYNVIFHGFMGMARVLINDKSWKRKIAWINQTTKFGLWEGDFFEKDCPAWVTTILHATEVIDDTQRRKAAARMLLGQVDLQDEVV